MPEVNSTHINSMEYDAKTGTLTVTFRNGAVYAYDGVPAPIYEAMTQAPSIGTYFMQKIRNAFTTRRIQ